MARGTHPKSLQNLTHEGRPLEYGEPKKIRRLSVTQSGWDKAKQLLTSMGMSISELVEELGRGNILIMTRQEIDAFQDAIDSALLRQAIAQADGEFMTLDEVLSERELKRADLDE